LANFTTHTPYKPGPWATDQVRIWQKERAEGFKASLKLMEKVGAVGILASDRLHGFWWMGERPFEAEFWKRLAVPNKHSKSGSFRSAVGKGGVGIWEPRRTVMHKGVERMSPLYDEFHSIRIKDWWHLSVALGMRPVFWPFYSLMLLPELEVLGDYGELIIIWSPNDRFGFSHAPMDCTELTKNDVKRYYAEAWRDMPQVPVIESYIGDDLQFRFDDDWRDKREEP